jgi:predicted amidophosphoribosyltransferase
LSIEINPRRLNGPWDFGYALDTHIVSSAFLGYDGAGRARFDSARSPIGELLYRLKYKSDQTTIEPIVEAVADFFEPLRSLVDSIVPVPPSNVRARQQVTLIVMALSKRLQIPVCDACLSKVKRTPQLKDITEYDKRVEALDGAFSVAVEHTQGKALMLFDDLYGSGATVTAITELLKGTGRAKAVYLLTLTARK